MAESSEPPLSLPPFPPLRWDGYFWTGRVVLGSWRGFQSRLGAYGTRSSAKESDGSAFLSVSPPGGDSGRTPSAEQADSLQYLFDHEREIRDEIVAAVLEEYPKIRASRLGDAFYDESEMPPLERSDQLKSHLGLSTVHILRVVKDDSAYIGFEFGCTWNPEHGLGVMTHRGRIVEFPHMGLGKVSGGDIASEDWVAEEDARSSA